MKIVVDKKGLLLIILLFFLVFQNPLESVWSYFGYIDEIIPLFGILYIAANRKDIHWNLVIPLMTFILAGLLGNVIYQYQPVSLVLTDLYANIKFFLCIFSGLYFFHEVDGERLQIAALWFSKITTVVLAVFSVLDYLLDLYPNGYRYGIRMIKLFYSHPTYLAGALTMLVLLFTMFPQERNIFYIIIDLLILILTLRSKAIAFSVIYILFYFLFMKRQQEIKKWHISTALIVALIIGFSQIRFYFGQLSGQSARSVFLLTSFKILKDYFPIGTGFGTFASHVASASVSYSPVYYLYGFNSVYELRNTTVGTFFDDQFWPIIFGQTGVIGSAAYIILLVQIIILILKIKNIKIEWYYTGLLIMLFLLISSVAESAFNNSVACGMALLLGIIFEISEKFKNSQSPESEEDLSAGDAQ